MYCAMILFTCELVLTQLTVNSRSLPFFRPTSQFSEVKTFDQPDCRPSSFASQSDRCEGHLAH